jgi:hypothetical protein
MWASALKGPVGEASMLVPADGKFCNPKVIGYGIKQAF